MLFEYARVPTTEQHLDLQRDALTQAGLNAARARGRNGGRPYKLSRKGVELAVTMLSDPNNRSDDICATVGMSRAPL